MKALVYALLFVVLVPIQSVVMPHLSLLGVKPDLGLIAVSMVGLFAGELEGLFVGLVLGWIMSLFSADLLLLSMVTKGAVGYMAGLAGRQVAYLTPMALVMGLLVVSTMTGLLMAFVFELNDQQDVLWALRVVILPQACFDAVLGGVIYWVIWGRLTVDRFVSAYRV